MTWIMTTTLALTILSAILLLALICIYAKNLQKFKSPHLIGLLIFAGVFFVQNCVSLYYFITMMAYYVPEVAGHVFVLTLLQTIAFSVLLKITWK